MAVPEIVLNEFIRHQHPPSIALTTLFSENLALTADIGITSWVPNFPGKSSWDIFRNLEGVYAP